MGCSGGSRGDLLRQDGSLPSSGRRSVARRMATSYTHLSMRTTRQESAAEIVQGPPSPRWPDGALRCAVFLTLIAVPLAIWGGVIDYNLGKAAVLLVFMPVLTVLWGGSLRATGQRQLVLPWILIPLALFGLAGLLSLIHAVNHAEAVQMLLVSASFVQLLVILVHVTRREHDAALLVGALLLAGTVAGLIGLLQYLGILEAALGRTGPSAMSSTFGNKNYLGAFLACLLFPAGALVLRGGSVIRRVVAGVLCAFTLAILLLVDQMATPFALLAGSLVGLLLVLVAAGAKRKRIAKGPLLLFLVVAVVAVSVIAVRIWPAADRAAAVHPPEDDRSPLERMAESNSIDSRLLFWSVGWEMLEDRPLTGIGVGNYRFLYTPYEAKVRTESGTALFPNAATRTEVAHNDYVQVAAELGIGGILAMIAFLAVLAWVVWVRLAASRDSSSRTAWILLLAAGVTVFLAHALVSFPLHLPASALVTTVLLALLFSPITGEAGTSYVTLSRGGWRAIFAGMVLLASTGAALAACEVEGHALMQRAAAQLSGGDPGAAQETLARSIRMRFSPRCSVYYLATAQAQLGHYDLALASFERCFSCCTADRAYLFYADLASQLGEIDAAMDAIDILLGTVPKTDIRIRAERVREQIEGLANPETPPEDETHD